MLVYMIHELLTEKNLSMSRIDSYLRSFSGDAYMWYGSLDCTEKDWERPFFKKYLTMPSHTVLRFLYGKLDEQQILNRIAFTIRTDMHEFADTTEAREKAFRSISLEIGMIIFYRDLLLTKTKEKPLACCFRRL